MSDFFSSPIVLMIFVMYNYIIVGVCFGFISSLIELKENKLNSKQKEESFKQKKEDFKYLIPDDPSNDSLYALKIKLITASSELNKEATELSVLKDPRKGLKHFIMRHKEFVLMNQQLISMVVAKLVNHEIKK